MANSRPSESNGGGQAFDRLHPIVQRWVWDKGWTELRDIQAQAIDVILGSNADVVIAAATAGGKTEAAFLPILSALGPSPGHGFRALYVGPLKALINDQFLRLEDLCERLELPVVKWHGDAPQSMKKRARREPSGVMLITPESIEAMFLRRPADIDRMFNELRFLVIDELHAFLDSERGVHLASLLNRLERRIERRPRRIGLSATLGDFDIAARWLNPAMSDTVVILKSNASPSELRLQLRGVIEPAPRQNSTSGLHDDVDEISANSQPIALEEIAEHLYSTLRARGNHLVFSGSRRNVEELADRLRIRCENANVPNEFFPHHGNLARDARESLEARLKEGRQPTTAVATTTLELGIDIGGVESVAQVGAPNSIAALRQRLGRSGRRAGTASVMRLYAIEAELTDKSDIRDRLRVATIQAVAAVRLLVARWIEPPRPGMLRLSTLLHQVLSVITERGGAKAQSIHASLCGAGPFSSVTPELFLEVLRAMARPEAQLIEQAPDGTLMLGPIGERLVHGYDFYAVFTTQEEFRIVHETRTLGTLSIENAFGPGDYLIFSGRRWQIRSVDDRGKAIYVIPAPAGRVPKFFGGEALPLHDRLVEEMLAVFVGDDLPAFLNSQAQDHLGEGRDAFRTLGLDRRQMIVEDGRIHLFPWCGTRGLDTLRLALKRYGIGSTPYAIGITVDNGRCEDLLFALTRLASEPAPAPIDIAADVRTLSNAKYDRFLTDEVLQKALAADRLEADRLPALAKALLGRRGE